MSDKVIDGPRPENIGGPLSARQRRTAVAWNQRRFVGLVTASMYYDISVTAFRVFIEDGELPAYRVGRRVLVSVDELEKFIRSHRVGKEGLDH